MGAREATQQRMVGGFLLGARLGRGGAGEVYAASHPRLGPDLAIKLMHEPMAADPAARAALLAEATRARAVRHPAVVRVVEVGRDDALDLGFLVMERIHGEDLAARIARVGRLEEADVRALFAAIADGMQAVHAGGLVHRDLKPANVMLRGDTPCIVDFGIARALGDASALVTSRRMGTPAYMAPEQLTGGVIAPCVDLWALGVMLFEAVTGRLPFQGFADGRCPQLFETAPRARTLVLVSLELDALIARCLDRDPARRPGSMGALAAALRGEALPRDVDERLTQDLVEVRGLATAAPGRVAPGAGAPGAATPRKRLREWILVSIGGLAAVTFGVIAANLVAHRHDDAAPRAVDIAIATASKESPVVSPEPSPIAPPITSPVALPVAPPIASRISPRIDSPSAAASVVALDITTTPAGATILVGGKHRGVTPARITLPAATAARTAIELRRAGYRTAHVTAAHRTAITITLAPLPGRPPESLD